MAAADAPNAPGSPFCPGNPGRPVLPTTPADPAMIDITLIHTERDYLLHLYALLWLHIAKNYNDLLI